MAEAKTKPGPQSVEAFLQQVEPERRRVDAGVVCDLLRRISGLPPVMWGGSIIGFGSYRYRYASGREGEAPRIAFSPRASSLVLYAMDGFPEHAALLSRLGKHKTGKSCLYINKLSDVDQTVLEELIRRSLAAMDARYPREAREA